MICPPQFTLQEWLLFLENRHASHVIHLGLERTLTVAKRLNLLSSKAFIITVAGTNGKGSTVSSLESIYNAANYKIGSYTSPHLLIFNERIRVNQQNISDDDLCAAFTVVEKHRDEVDLTYFEFITLAAMWHFSQQNLDVLILEVGMGGRLDATNILHPDLSIITTVDFDHQAYLGNTLEAIGAEKAGIMRAYTPCIYADFTPPTSILEAANKLHAKLYCLDVDYRYEAKDDALLIEICKQNNAYCAPPKNIRLPLPHLNLKAAVAAVIASEISQDKLPLKYEHWQHAMLHASIKGRQQLIQHNGISILFDVAHNPQAVRLLAELIHKNHADKTIHAIFSGLQDKDLCGLVKPLIPYVQYWYIAHLVGQRAATHVQLNAAFEGELCENPPCFDNPIEAYYAAIKQAKCGDLIIIYGSFLTVGPVIAECVEDIS